MLNPESCRLSTDTICLVQTTIGYNVGSAFEENDEHFRLIAGGGISSSPGPPEQCLHRLVQH